MSSITITDVRNDLLQVFAGLKDGTIEAKDAAELNNTAGKIISSAKVELAYHALRGDRPDIPFLGLSNEKLIGETKLEAVGHE